MSRDPECCLVRVAADSRLDATREIVPNSIRNDRNPDLGRVLRGGVDGRPKLLGKLGGAPPVPPAGEHDGDRPGGRKVCDLRGRDKRIEED